MAYKFQRGAAIISGSIQAEEGLQSVLDSNIIASGSSAEISLKIDDGQTEVVNVDFLNNEGRIRIFDNSGNRTFIADDAELSSSYDIKSGGDIVLTPNASIGIDSDTDLLTLNNNEAAVRGTLKADSVASLNATNGLDIDGSGANTGTFNILLRDAMASALDIKEGSNSYQKFVTTNSGEKIVFGVSTEFTSLSSSAAATLDVVSASILASADLTAGRVPFVGANGVLRDSSKLAYNDTAGNGLAVDNVISGSGNLTIAGNISTDGDIVFAARNTAIGAALGANNLTLGQSTSTVVVPGNLTVQGSTTTIDSTTINISRSFTFEGPADAHETTLEVGTPVADTTVNLPALLAGTDYELAAFSVKQGSNAAISASVGEINAVADGSSTVSASVTVVDADGIILNDNGVMKQIRASNLKDYAYENNPLPIGFEQTISQPYIVALMTEALSLKGNEVILEIGTGSGYQTSILSIGSLALFI